MFLLRISDANIQIVSKKHLYFLKNTFHFSLPLFFLRNDGLESHQPGGVFGDGVGAPPFFAFVFVDTFVVPPVVVVVGDDAEVVGLVHDGGNGDTILLTDVDEFFEGEEVASLSEFFVKGGAWQKQVGGKDFAEFFFGGVVGVLGLEFYVVGKVQQQVPQLMGYGESYALDGGDAVVVVEYDDGIFVVCPEVQAEQVFGQGCVEHAHAFALCQPAKVRNGANAYVPCLAQGECGLFGVVFGADCQFCQRVGKFVGRADLLLCVQVACQP